MSSLIRSDLLILKIVSRNKLNFRVSLGITLENVRDINQFSGRLGLVSSPVLQL